MSPSDETTAKLSTTGLPFVTVKFAQSLDGRIATATGDSKWISQEQSRRFAHQLRSEHEAIIVGIGTVLADDPQLTVRLVSGRAPLRVVLDSRLRIPSGSRVLSTGEPSGTLIVCAEDAEAARAREIEDLGAEVLRLPLSSDQSRIDLALLLRELGRRGIASVLVEGGREVITSMLAARLADRLVAIIAPKIIGQGTEAVGDLGIERLDQAIRLSSVKTHRLGDDIVFDARLK